MLSLFPSVQQRISVACAALGIKSERCRVVFYNVICEMFLILQHTPVGQMVFAI
jgi:hypothetical protein